MATMQEYIERLIYQFTSTGADKVADDMNKVGAAQTTTSTSALNLEKSFNSLERRMDSSVRAAQDYAKIQAQVAAAVAQNPALQERANNILALAEQRYAAAARGGSLYGQALNAGQAQMQAFAAQAGILGDALTALGTKGLAGAAAIGGLTLAYKAASDQAHELGQKAIDLKKFADTTGLSTNQVQALRIEASKVGVSSEETETALQRFTLSFEAVRQGSGEALETLRRYRPELAEQMRDTRSAATAIDILSQAYVGLTTAQQNAISRSFFGRGGIDMSQLMKGLNLDEATEKFAASGRGLTDELATKLKELEITSQRLNKQLGEGMAKLFAQDLLERENQFKQGLINIFAELKNFQPPEWLSKLNDIGKWAGQNLTGAGLAAQFVTSKAAEKPATFSERFGALPSMTPIADELDRAAKSAEKINEEFRKLPTREVVAMGEAVARGFNTADQTVADLKRKIEDMVNALGRIGTLNLAPGDEEARVNALLRAIDAAQVLLKVTQDTTAETARHNSELLKLADKYQGMSLDVAQVLEKQRGQLSVAEAATGQARMAAQEQATINDLLLQGKTLMEATAVAAGQRAIAQAQVNTGAQQQLAALQDQYQVASAVTGLQKIQAQEAATIATLIRQGVDAQTAMAIGAQQTANALAQVNASAQQQLAALQDQYQVASAVTGLQKIQAQEAATVAELIRQGVDEETAMAVAAQKTANAIAEANSNLERQTISLREQNELSAARLRGGGDQIAGLQYEQIVAAQQAFNKALASGADEEHALANAEQVRLKYSLQIAEAAEREWQARVKAAEAEQEQINKDIDRIYHMGESSGGGGGGGGGTPFFTSGVNTTGSAYLDTINRQLKLAREGAERERQRAEEINKAQEVDPQKQAQEAAQKQAQAAQEAAQKRSQAAQEAAQKQSQFEEQIQQLQNQRELAEARKVSPEAEAQVQAQQAYAEAIKGGASAAQAQQIADLTLANALAANTSAVQSNTDVLSSAYATDPRLSHLGFRAGSSALDYDPFAQPATGAAGPAALPFGSTTATSSGLASAGSSEEEGHWEGGGLSMKWVGSGPPNYSQLKAWTQGLAGGGVIPPGGLAYVGEHGPNPGLLRAGNEQIVVSPRTPYLATDSGRPVQIVQNFNGPVDQSVAAQMKTTAYQAVQAGMRSLRAVR